MAENPILTGQNITVFILFIKEFRMFVIVYFRFRFLFILTTNNGIQNHVCLYDVKYNCDFAQILPKF